MESIFRGCITGLLALSLFLAGGCGKKDDAAVGASVQIIDASKLRPSFTSASDDLKAMVENVMTAIQSSDYRTAMANLDKLSQSSSLTGEQQKVVNDVKTQVEKKQAAIAAP